MVEYNTQGTLRGTKPPLGTSSVAAGSPQAASRATEQSNTEQRETMIREAAYFRAEHRSFAPGNELDDWFAAEREIDAVLAPRFRDAAGAR